MSNENYSCSCFLCKSKNCEHSKRVSKATYFHYKSYSQTIEINDSQQELKILTKNSLLTFITRTGIILSKTRAWLLYCLIKTETYNINHYTYWLDISKKIGTLIYTIQYKNMADLLLRIIMKTMKMAMSRMVIIMRMML